MATVVTQRKHTATKHLSQAKQGERGGCGQLQPSPRRGAVGAPPSRTVVFDRAETREIMRYEILKLIHA